jgi:hypothetical protein
LTISLIIKRLWDLTPSVFSLFFLFNYKDLATN